MLHNPEAENYRQVADKYSALARACLAVGDFILNPSLSAIDALIICVSYHHNMDDRLDGHKGWVLLGVALKLAVGVSAPNRGYWYLTNLSLNTKDGTAVSNLPSNYLSSALIEGQS